jgi:hypothetical protein
MRPLCCPVILPRILAAAPAASPLVEEAGPIGVSTHTALLLLGLLMLGLLIKLFIDLRERLERIEQLLAVASTPAARTPAPGEIPAHTLAVIASAVVDTIGRAHRIVGVRSLSDHETSRNPGGERELLRARSSA